MLIGYDGGAFQPGMSEAIRGCAIGFLNAAVEIDPSLEIVLVADLRLGAIPADMLERLRVRPEILYAEVSPSYEPPQRGLLTGDPDVRFRDRRELAPERVEQVAVQPPRASLEAGGLDEMRRADRRDVHLEARMLADQDARRARMVEVDVREEQMPDVRQLQPALA